MIKRRIPIGLKQFSAPQQYAKEITYPDPTGEKAIRGNKKKSHHECPCGCTDTIIYATGDTWETKNEQESMHRKS